MNEFASAALLVRAYPLRHQSRLSYAVGALVAHDRLNMGIGQAGPERGNDADVVRPARDCM